MARPAVVTCAVCAGAGAIAPATAGRYPPAPVKPLPPFVVPLVTSALIGPMVGCRFIPRVGPAPAAVANSRRLANEGLAAADRQQYDEAEALLDRAVKSCPADVEARRHYAEVLWERGERLAAVQQITTALGQSPGDADLCVVGARMYTEMGLLEDADRLAREAARTAPQMAAAWRVRGQVALARGNDREALAAFHRGLALAPDDRPLLLDTAEVYRRLGQPRRVLSTLAILGETYGADRVPPEVLVLEGAAQESLGRTADAVASYRRALDAAGTEGSPQAAARLAALLTPPSSAVAASPDPATTRR